MEWLQTLVDTYKGELPLLAAFALGLMMALSPCPLATNITATAYLSKDISEKGRVLALGLLYTLGRMFSYSALGLLFYFGASQFKVSQILQGIGGLWLGIALIIAGVLMLDLIKVQIPWLDKLQPRIAEGKGRTGYLSAFFMGLIFALAFCPFSGVLYFGVLIPMTLASPSGLLLPPVFAFATGLPVMLFAWLMAYSMSSIGTFYNRLKSFERYFKRIVAALFIVVGIYYLFINL